MAEGERLVGGIQPVVPCFIDCPIQWIAALPAVKVSILGHALVVVVVLVRKQVVVVSLAAATTGSAARDPRVDDDIVVAGL